MANSTSTTGDRDQACQQALEQLEQATAALLTTDGWRAWLRVRATLHT